MAPMTAARMADIHSNAARLLAKPMLPSVAKTTRMIIRRPKRNITWIDFDSRERWGDCATTGKPAALSEIVGQNRVVERICLTRHEGNAGPARWCMGEPRIDEGAQDRQRQIRVMGLDRLIQPFRKLALP